MYAHAVACRPTFFGYMAVGCMRGCGGHGGHARDVMLFDKLCDLQQHREQRPFAWWPDKRTTAAEAWDARKQCTQGELTPAQWPPLPWQLCIWSGNAAE